MTDVLRIRRRASISALALGASVACTTATSPPESTATPGPSGTAALAASPGESSPSETAGPAITWTFIFKGRVPKDLRRTVRRHTERATMFFTAPELDLAPEERYVEVYGEQSPYDSETSLCGQLTEAGGIRIFLLSCQQNESTSRIALIQTIIHEVFHAIQERVIDTYDVDPQLFLDGQLPKWFREGAATWASAIAMDRWGVMPYRESRAVAATHAAQTEADLRKLATGRGWQAGDTEQVGLQYGLAFLAVERVAGKDWKSSLEVYRAAVSEQVPAWSKAFKETFGIRQKNFYKRFERYRDQGFPAS